MPYCCLKQYGFFICSYPGIPVLILKIKLNTNGRKIKQPGSIDYADSFTFDSILFTYSSVLNLNSN